MRLVVLLAIIGVYSHSVHGALTDEELASITNSGCCGGTVSVSESGSDYVFSSNALMDHMWEEINPNYPEAGDISFTTPQDPTITDGVVYCVSQGSIAMAKNGVPFFGPLTSSWLNAVEGDSEEEMDFCGGHPSPNMEYHYHELPYPTSECDNPVYDPDDSTAQFIGVSYDGHPIYSQGTYDGVELGASVDECNGEYLPDGRYAYIAVTNTFPYVIGCYKSQPDGVNANQCPDGGEAGQICQCDGGSSEWLSRSDVTTESKNLGLQAEFMKVLQEVLFEKKAGHSRRTRRSPRFTSLFKMMTRQSVDSCLADNGISTCGEDDADDSDATEETSDSSSSSSGSSSSGSSSSGSSSSGSSSGGGRPRPGPRNHYGKAKMHLKEAVKEILEDIMEE